MITRFCDDQYYKKVASPNPSKTYVLGINGQPVDASGIGGGNVDLSNYHTISQYQDWILMRYSDVLLMAAELGSSNAQTYFNDVRTRAYTQDDGTLSANYTAITATRDNIWNERKKEFAFEGLRYWDELRQGLQSAASQIAESNTALLSGGVKENVNITAQNIIDKRGFCQIPITQITLSNGVLKQNHGW